MLIVSDSEYLVKGMREWAPGWAARGWIRKAGPDREPRALAKRWSPSARLHEVQWTWVRGHQGHAKNEYANDLAVAAAKEQKTSDGIVDSGFEAWLEIKRAKGLYSEYDPDAAFAAQEQRLVADVPFPLAEAR